MKRRYRLNNYLVLERPIAQIGYAKEMLCFNLIQKHELWCLDGLFCHEKWQNVPNI